MENVNIPVRETNLEDPDKRAALVQEIKKLLQEAKQFEPETRMRLLWIAHDQVLGMLTLRALDGRQAPLDKNGYKMLGPSQLADLLERTTSVIVSHEERIARQNPLDANEDTEGTTQYNLFFGSKTVVEKLQS